MGVVFYAFSQKKTPVLSHGLVSALFQHPDPRQSWTGLSPSEANSPEVAKTIVRIECNYLPNERGEWGKGKVSGKFVGLHGTPCLRYGYKSAAAQVPELFGLAPSSRTSLSDDLMCQAFSAWMFSTLNPQATEALSLYRNDFKENCGSPDDPIDLAVQVRAHDNIEAPFPPDLQQCYVECAAHKGLQLEKSLGRKVCIFVTSNRDSLADYIVEHLRSVSSNFAFLAHAYNDTHVEGTKHSSKLLMSDTTCSMALCHVPCAIVWYVPYTMRDVQNSLYIVQCILPFITPLTPYLPLTSHSPPLPYHQHPYHPYHPPPPPPTHHRKLIQRMEVRRPHQLHPAVPPSRLN
jgi:hypothetical protein